MRDRGTVGIGEVVSGGPLRPFTERSVPALVRDRARKYGDKEAVRFRTRSGRWQELSWGQLDFLRRLGAAALIEQGLAAGDRVLLVSPNGIAMLIAELALLSAGAVSVPVFPDYSKELVGYCARHSGARMALCGSSVHQQKLAGEGGAGIERIVVLDDEPFHEPRALSVQQGIAHFRALPEKRREALDAQVEASTGRLAPEDLAFLLYTSGTTGKPKGVALTHGNVLSQQAAISAVWEVGEGDVFLSYLPWHHCFGALFERMMALWNGALLVLDDSRGRDLERLLQNFREAKPTVYFSVPRVYQALMAQAVKDPAAEATLLHGRLRFVFTAAAPLPEPVYRFFEQSGVPVHEGWGLTETSPCATLTRKDEARVAGCVGPPLPGTEVKLASVEQAAPGLGEVLVRGPQVMRGYFDDEESTRRTIGADGFLRTGDLGEWTPQGLRIRGRIDGVFKLHNGEKVPSGEVEARLLAATPLLEQAVVLGPGQPFATALLWLNAAMARAFAEAQGAIGPGEPMAYAGLTRLPEIRRAITEALQSANLFAPVPFERVKRAALVHEPLEISTGELTPTQKVVRTVAMARHAELIAALGADALHPQVLQLSTAEPAQ